MSRAGRLFEMSVLGAPNTEGWPEGAQPIVVAVGSSQRTRRNIKTMFPEQSCWELVTYPLPRWDWPNTGVQS